MFDTDHSDGKYNSTTISDGVKVEENDWQDRDKLWWERTHESSFNSRYLENEYSMSFNFDESLNLNEDTRESNDGFPISLNPLFDLNALIMVTIKVVNK